MPIIDRDHGYKKIMVHSKVLAKTGGAIDVGVDDSPRSDSNLTNAQVALIQEFGDANIPARPFLRTWVDANTRGIQTSLGVAANKVLRGQKTWSEAFEKFADYAVKGVKRTILSNLPPPLAPSTVRKKGHDQSLIDTEQMVNAVIAVLEPPMGSL